MSFYINKLSLITLFKMFSSFSKKKLKPEKPMNEVPTAKLVRSAYDKEGTIGQLIIDGERFCYTLERPDNGNKPDDKTTPENDSGCIPEGIYQVERDTTGKFRYFAIKGVPNRQNIEIHQGNCIDDILGCIILGEELIVGNTPYRGKNYKYFLTNSKKTCERLKAKMPDKWLLHTTSI